MNDITTNFISALLISGALILLLFIGAGVEILISRINWERIKEFLNARISNR